MENYMKFQMIGKGCGGNCVFLVKNLSDNKLYAMKRIIIDVNDEKQNFKNMNEIEIFKKINHKNLIKYIESFIHKDMLCIIMEYADGGDLSAIVKEHAKNKNKIKIDEQMIWNWFLQICQAIKYIHSKKILHRDIKCQNIFLTKKGQIKLGDFGISKILLDSFDFAKTPLGTPYFLSPEICMGSKYNFKTDIWMIGCVLYELCALRKPFEGDNLPSLMMNILKNEVIPIPKAYSDELKFLISQLLIKDPNLRPSLSEILKYDFIINKMTNLGLDESYENWDECPNSLSPVNEDSPSFPLFNLKIDNIAKIRETDEEDLSSSAATEKTIIPEEKKSIVGCTNNKNCTGSSIMKRMQKKKYSPSYGIEEMNQVMNGLRIDTAKKDDVNVNKKNSGTSCNHSNNGGSSISNSLIKMNSNEPMKSKINLAKNQYSEPNLKNGMKSHMPGSQYQENLIGQLDMLTMEEKIKRNRNNSINLPKGDNFVFINHRQSNPIACKNLITPSEIEKKPLLSNPKISTNSNRSSNYNTNTNSGILSSPSVQYCSTSACDYSSFGSNNTCKHRTKELSSKKQTPKQIYITMDIDSPEHKTIIHVEEENQDGKKGKDNMKDLLLPQKNSAEEKFKVALAPSVVVRDSKYPKVSLRYQYYESIYGAQNMEKLVKVIEDSMGEAIKSEKDIEEIFCGCQKENYAAQIFNYACYIANLCYGKLSK